MRPPVILAICLMAIGCSNSSSVVHSRTTVERVIPAQKTAPSFWGGSTRTVASGELPLWKGEGKWEYMTGLVQMGSFPSILERGAVVWEDPQPSKFDWDERGWWRMD